MGIFIFRVFILGLIIAAGYFFPFFKVRPELSAAVAGLLGLIIMYLETKIRKAQFKTIWASTLGRIPGSI